MLTNLSTYTINGMFQFLPEDMVTCTLDYEWPTHVVASLILLVGGLIIMLLVRYVCRWSSVRCDRLHGCRQHLLSVQEAADVILSGDSLVSKIFVSFDFYARHYSSSSYAVAR